MKPDKLIRDPVFQLNLLLWMTKDQPADAYVVRPLFFEHGFRLIYIEQPFPFPKSAINAINGVELPISTKPEPEILLGRTIDMRALYIEAKAESFSPTSTTAKQARGHLLATGEVFREVFEPLNSCLLCYVIPEGRRELMSQCLAELTAEMSSRNLSVGTSSVHGLDLQGTDLHYAWDGEFQNFVGMTGLSRIVMTNVTDETDPSPLLLVYSVEDYPDTQRQDFLRRALVEQTHARLVCAFNELPVVTELRFTADSLLHEVTDGVFQYVGRDRQKKMREFVRTNVLRRIAEYSHSRFIDVVEFDIGELRIWFPNSERKGQFLEWFEDHKKTSFAAKRVDPSLFDEDFS